jgi:hypothetical protein
MEQIRLSSSAPYDSSIIDFLNMILGHQGEASTRFWNKSIKDHLEAKYGVLPIKICFFINKVNAFQKKRKSNISMYLQKLKCIHCS